MVRMNSRPRKMGTRLKTMGSSRLNSRAMSKDCVAVNKPTVMMSSMGS